MLMIQSFEEHQAVRLEGEGGCRCGSKGMWMWGTNTTKTSGWDKTGWASPPKAERDFISWIQQFTCIFALTLFILLFVLTPTPHSPQNWLAQSNRRAIEGLCRTMRVAAADLFIFLQFCVIDLSDLGQFGSVIWVFNRVIWRTSRGCRGCSCCRRSPTFLRTWNPFCQKHIVQSH